MRLTGCARRPGVCRVCRACRRHDVVSPCRARPGSRGRGPPPGRPHGASQHPRRARLAGLRQASSPPRARRCARCFARSTQRRTRWGCRGSERDAADTRGLETTRCRTRTTLVHRARARCRRAAYRPCARRGPRRGCRPRRTLRLASPSRLPDPGVRQRARRAWPRSWPVAGRGAAVRSRFRLRVAARSSHLPRRPAQSGVPARARRAAAESRRRGSDRFGFRLRGGRAGRSDRCLPLPRSWPSPTGPPDRHRRGAIGRTPRSRA